MPLRHPGNMTLQSLTSEITAVHLLAVETEEPDHGHRRREYLVRRAAVGDRAADCAVTTPHDADRYAAELVAYDRQYDTGLGPMPATDPYWDHAPRTYARQEHQAWILALELP